MLNHLKPADIVIITKQSPETLQRLSFWVPRTIRQAHVDQGLDPVRLEQTKIPGHHSPPVMANQESLVNTQMVKEANKVTDDVERGVGGGGGRRVSVTVATEVRGDATVAKGREGEKLVAP